jgi:uncharacterized protein (DUF58 family)
MWYDDLHRLQRQREMLLGHRLWYLLAAGLGVISVISRQPLIFVLGLLIGVISAMSEIWYRRGQRDLTVEQRLSTQRAFVGDVIALETEIENRKSLPLPNLEVESDLPNSLRWDDKPSPMFLDPQRHILRSSLSLGRWQRATRENLLYCAERGAYWIGSPVINTRDPIGWLSRSERYVRPAIPLLIYPIIAPLDKFNLPAMYPFGQLVSTRRLLEDPLRVAGARDYVPGDDPRLIHWKATARTGALRTKVLDPSGQHRIILILDINSSNGAYFGFIPSLLELNICVAASIAHWALDEGFATGLLGTSPIIPEETIMDNAPPSLEPLWLSPSSHRSQRERILSSLARLQPHLGAPIEALIDYHRRSFVAGTTAILISSTHALRQQTIEYLAELQPHGVGAHIVLIGSTYDLNRLPTFDIPMHYIGGKEVWDALVTAARQNAAGNLTDTVSFSLG